MDRQDFDRQASQGTVERGRLGSAAQAALRSEAHDTAAHALAGQATHGEARQRWAGQAWQRAARHLGACPDAAGIAWKAAHGAARRSGRLRTARRGQGWQRRAGSAALGKARRRVARTGRPRGASLDKAGHVGLGRHGVARRLTTRARRGTAGWAWLASVPQRQARHGRRGTAAYDNARTGQAGLEGQARLRHDKAWDGRRHGTVVEPP